MTTLTTNFRQSVLGYFLTSNTDVKLLHFNKLVSICTTNTAKLFIPTRTKGIGFQGKRAVKDRPIKDLAEEYVAQMLFDLTGKDVEELVQSGRFDYSGHRFKQRVINEILRINRSREEEWIEELPSEDGSDDYDDEK